MRQPDRFSRAYPELGGGGGLQAHSNAHPHVNADEYAYPPTNTPTATPTTTPTATPTSTNLILPDSGGTITETVGLTVSVVFPSGAVSDPVEIIIEPVTDPPAHGGFQMAGQAFEITARTLLGEQVTSFSSPFVLTI